MKIEYKILTAMYPGPLAVEIEAHVAEGWELHGGLTNGITGHGFAQAVIKRVVEEANADNPRK